MGKKKHGRAMFAVRKYAKQILSGVRAAVIGFTAGHGLISATVQTAQDGQWQGFGNRTVYYYTGLDPTAGTFDQNQAIKSVGTIIGGLITAALIGAAAKRI